MDNTHNNLLPSHGELHYYPSFIDGQLAQRYYDVLLKGISWQQESITIYGKQVLQPRLTAWYGAASYTYSGTTMSPQPWTPPLSEIKSMVECFTGATFNSVLLNLYRDGKDYMGWHRDNEKELGTEPVIASVSLGAVRSFQVRKYKTKDRKLSIEAAPGSLITMQGIIQSHWEHCLPKRLRVKDSRINLTFRRIVDT